MSIISKYVTKKNIKKKNRIDKIVKNSLFIISIIAASFIVVIILFNLQQGVKPLISDNGGLGRVSLLEILVRFEWLDGKVNATVGYGIGYLIINTLISVFLAISIALPIGVITGLFIAKIAPKAIAEIFRTIVELLASIPSIIYGVFGLGVITKITIFVASIFGQQTSAGISMMTTILVLALMILPIITVMSENAIRSVSSTLEEGSLALGSSAMQTYFKVIIPAAKSGIFAGVILGVGRALGEATAVSLVSGNAFSGPTLNPFGTTATLTSRMLTGFRETTGVDQDFRFTVGLVLMVIIIITNFILKKIMKKVGNINEG